MRRASILAPLLLFIALLAITNPGMEGYKTYLAEKITKETKGEGKIVEFLGDTFSDELIDLLEGSIDRKNYGLFSIYEMEDLEFGEKDRVKHLGILGFFFKL